MEEQTQNKTQQKQENTTNKGGRYALKRFFSAKRMAVIAVFSALAFVVSLFDFPIFPATPFLKLDFGNVFILLVSFLLGPIEGVISCVVKETLRIIGSSSGGVGEIANMITTCAYILLPSVVYHYKKGIKTVAVCLFIACFLGTGAALLTNRFITFPLYMGAGAAAVFEEVFLFIVLFNLIKTASVSVLTLLLYKRLSLFFKKMKI